MITSFIEMLHLPNFGHMTTYTIQLESRDIVEAKDRNYDVINFISKYLYLRRPRAATFANIIKIVTMFIKTITEKELERMY